MKYSGFTLFFLAFVNFWSFSQSFQTGFNWLSTNGVSNATSPNYTSGNCTNINYNISSSQTFRRTNNGAPYNNNCLYMPANASNTATNINMTFTFNQPVSNLRIRFIDLDENNSGLPQPEESLTQINPTPSSVSSISIANPFYLVGNTVTPFDNNPSNNNNNTAGWINWNGTITSISFRYNRPSSVNAGLIIDSIYFDCPINCNINANAGSDFTICNSTPSTINAFNANATSYLWNTGATTSSINVSNPGTYWVDVSNGTCFDRDTVVVTSDVTPDVFLGVDTAACATAPMILYSINATNGNYLWSNNATTNSITVNQSGDYWVQISNVCGTDYDTINVILEIPPNLNLGNDTNVCANTQLTLNTAIPNAIFYWQDNSSNPTFNVTQAGSYWVTAITSNCFVSDTIEIGINTPPSVMLGNDITVCSNINTILTPTITGTYTSINWNNNSSILTQTATTSGVYWIDVTNVCGSDRDSVNVTIQTAPILNLGNDTTICANTTLALNPNISNATYLWQNNSTAATFNVNQAGIYWVNVTSGSCTVRDSIIVQLLNAPQVNLGNDISVCDVTNTVLTPSITGNYTNIIWNNNSNTLTQTASISGIYWVEVSNICGTYRDSIQVNIDNSPIVNLGNDTTICANTTLALNPNISNATYLWQNNSTAATFNVNQTGTYWVDVTRGSCTVRDSIIVQLLNAPQVNLGNDITVCNVTNTVLTPSITGNYTNITWGNNSNTLTQTASISGIYWVELSNICGTDRDSIQVNIYNLPIVNLGNDTTICANTSLALNPNISNATYLWQNNSTAVTFNVNQAGTYWVDVTRGSCTVRDSIIVQLQNAPIVNLGNDSTLCNGLSTTLNATFPSATYLWQNNSTASILFVNQTGTYWVNVNNQCGTATDTFYLTIQNPPLINFSYDTTFCFGESITLSATTQNGSYLWSDNSTNSNLVVSQAGLYSVVVNVGACSIQHQFIIGVKPCETSIEMPTIFTPNGDGVNDYFFPVSYQKIKSAHLIIVNRWGNLIYDETNLLSGWDGKLNGIECTEGVYFWKIDYEDFNSSKFISHGFIHLER